jgi:hypothetical protein
MTKVRQDLYRIIYAIASVNGSVRSHELMRFLGLTRLEPYEFRLKRLVEDGYLVPENQVKQQFEQLVA